MYLSQKQSKKRTANDRIQAAIKNGLTEDITTISSDPIHRTLARLSQGPYRNMLDLWEGYCKAYPNNDPHQIPTLKHFVEVVARGSHGRVDKEHSPYATTHSIKTMIRQWRGALKRSGKIRISDEVLNTLCSYIDGPLKDKLGLSSAQRVPTFLTIDNLVRMKEHYWQADPHTYKHEGIRVQNSALLITHAYSSARRAEICQSRYKDVTFLVGWKGDEPDLKFGLRREIAKGMQNDPNKPEHAFYERLEPTPPLWAQPFVFYLPIFIAHRALKYFKTLESVVAAIPSGNERYMILEWEDHVLDHPVFPELLSTGATRTARSPDSWGAQCSAWAVRAEFPNGMGLHAARREALIQVDDGGYSLNQVMKFAAHKSSTTLGRHYLDSMSNVDGAASFLGLEARRDVTRDFRSATMQRKPGLPLSLPSRMQQELLMREDYQELSKNISLLSQQIRDEKNEEIRRKLLDQQEEMNAGRRKLRDQELKRYQSSYQVDYTSNDRKRDNDWRREFFDHVVRHMVPERARLADNITLSVPLRSPVGMQVMRDLLQLLTNNSPVAYQDTLRPVDGCCNVPACSQPMDSIPESHRWAHAYQCYKTYLESISNGFAQYCFLCNKWERSKADWDLHCQKHIDDEDLPFRADPVTFRKGLARAGYCRICLHNKEMSPTDRMFAYMHLSNWQRHERQCISEYINKLSKSSIPCPDPRCTDLGPFSSAVALTEHLEDCHSSHQRQLGRKRQSSSDSDSSESVSSACKRRKIQVGAETVATGFKGLKFVAFEPGPPRPKRAATKEETRLFVLDSDSEDSAMPVRPESNEKLGMMLSTGDGGKAAVSAPSPECRIPADEDEDDGRTSEVEQAQLLLMPHLVDESIRSLPLEQDMSSHCEELATPNMKSDIVDHTTSKLTKPSTLFESTTEDFEIERCLEVRVYNKRLQYRVKWLDFDDDQEWYNAANLRNCPHALMEFHIQNPTFSGPPKRLSYWIECWEKDIDAVDHADDNVPLQTRKRGRPRKAVVSNGM